MSKDLRISGFIATLRARFPQSTAIADKMHLQQGFIIQDDAYSHWLEDLACVCNKYMDSRDIDPLRTIFQFFAENYETGSTGIRQLIAAGFVEHLFSKTTDQGCELGWKLLPETLRKLYVNFHGRIPV